MDQPGDDKKFDLIEMLSRNLYLPINIIEN